MTEETTTPEKPKLPLSYWDCTFTQKANLAEEDLLHFYDYERMAKGVCVPSPPNYMAVPTAPKLQTSTWYELVISGIDSWNRSIGWATKEQTTELLDLLTKLEKFGFIDLDTRYLGGTTFKTLSQGRQRNARITIAPVELYDRSEVEAAAVFFKRIEEANKHNEKVRKEYEAQCEESEEITSKITADYSNVMVVADKFRLINKTYEQYLKLSGNDPATAINFLSIKYDSALIVTAFEFCREPGPDTAMLCDHVREIANKSPSGG